MAVIVNFGSYPQNGSDREPIEWRVLDVKGEEALLVSQHCLDCRPYHHEEGEIWENCDLRNWLNTDFLMDAFSGEEQGMIRVSDLPNAGNFKYGIPDAGNTRDRIFCLSGEEAERYFAGNPDRVCMATAHAVSIAWLWQGWRWLRDPGYDRLGGAFVSGRGYISRDGYDSENRIPVRPALRVNLGAVLARQR